MVGGFSESTFLQKAVKSQFENHLCKILVPQDTQLAVIKGAVLFGHFQEQVVTRIAQRTYGIGISQKFVFGLHDPNKRFLNEDGCVMCAHIFDTLIEVGTHIHVGYTIKKVYRITKNKDIIHLNLYFTQKKVNGINTVL